MTSRTQASTGPELTKIFAAASERVDQWSQLNALARAWATATPKGPRADKLHGEILKLWGAITRIEYCWAYPGPRLLTAISDGAGAARPRGVRAPGAESVAGAPHQRLQTRFTRLGCVGRVAKFQGSTRCRRISRRAQRTSPISKC